MRDYSCLDGEVVGMDAVSASQNVGPEYMDADNFYPADGDDPETVDISFDSEEDDLSGDSSDYFDGDSANSYFGGGRGGRIDKKTGGCKCGGGVIGYCGPNANCKECCDNYSFEGEGYSSYDGDDFFSVDGEGKERRQKKRDDRKGKREMAADERKAKREEAADERKAKREENRDLRLQKKKAKAGEIEARNKLTESLSQPDQTGDLIKSMQQPLETKSAEESKGMSTTTIILIAAGGLTLLGLTAFFLLRKKK